MNGVECENCGCRTCICSEDIYSEKKYEAKVVESIVDKVILLSGWRRKVIVWLWPELRVIVDILREYCWKDCR